MSASPFALRFAGTHRFGFLVGVELPEGGGPVADDVLARLDPREVAVARGLRGLRQVTWVGGRLAARAAGAHLGASDWVVLGEPGGEPVPQPGYAVSIAHKRGLAVALAAESRCGVLGVDLEDDVSAAYAGRETFLGEEERASIDALPRADRERALVLAFALKEATYKAFAGLVDHALGYDEARVRVVPGGLSLALAFRGLTQQPPVEVAHGWRDGSVIAAVRSRSHPRMPTAKPIE